MNYEEHINTIQEQDLNLKEYLKQSLKSDNKDICRGWDYLKTNLTINLKKILLNKKYQEITYNSENEDFILNELKEDLNEELKEQLGSFVYVWKHIKRDIEEKQEAEELKKELLERGFKEQEIIKKVSGEYKDLTEELKKLDGLKVYCVMDISKIGLMGSFDKKEELEGALTYSDHNNGLMLIPKRSRTRGFIIKNKFYYKEK